MRCWEYKLTLFFSSDRYQFNFLVSGILNSLTHYYLSHVEKYTQLMIQLGHKFTIGHTCINVPITSYVETLSSRYIVLKLICLSCCFFGGLFVFRPKSNPFVKKAFLLVHLYKMKHCHGVLYLQDRELY